MRWTEPGLQALWRLLTDWRTYPLAIRWSGNGQAEEIERLGIPALARLRLRGPRRDEASALRPRRLQRGRRPAGSEGAEQQGPLVLLRTACRRIQQELELLRWAQPRGSRAARRRGRIRRFGLPQIRSMAVGGSR